MPHVVLFGYLGCGNLGDDAVMLGAMSALGPEFKYTVLSGNPGETQRLYNVRAVDRRAMSAVDDAIEGCDALLIPGGSVFQDKTSVRSVAYYNRVVKRAKSRGKKVILLGQGVGPLGTFLGKRLAAGAFNAADYISVRDPDSAKLLKSIGVKATVRAAADSALLLPRPTRSEEEGQFGVGGMKSVAIAPRPFATKGVDVAELMGEFCRLLYTKGTVPTLVEMDPHEDGPLIDAISKSQGGRIPQLRKLGTPMALASRLARFDGVIAMRLHAGILGALVDVPPLMVSYDPKVSAFAREIGGPAAVPIEGCTPERLFEAYNGYAQSLPQLRQEIASRREPLQASARNSIAEVRRLLGVA